MKELNKTFLLFFAFLFVFVILCVSVQKSFYSQTGQAIDSTFEDSTISAVNIDYSNLEEELSKNGMIKSLPQNSKILLRFYNFDLGERLWERAYTLKQTGVKETTNLDEKADITLSIHSKYFKELTNKNFCEIIKKANENGDLGFETSLSKTSLAWKFKPMYKYRNCFGF